MSLTFLLTSLVICVSPGTGALYSIAAGLTRGARAGVLAAFACTLGVVPHAVAAITGLAALLHASGVAFAVVKYAGVAYLVYLAWSTWRDTGALSIERAPQSRTARQVIASGITLNLLNPKLTIFFFAFLPQFVPAGIAALAAAHGRPERGVHGDDVPDLRRLRAARRRDARAGAQPSAAARADAQGVRRLLPRPQRPPRRSSPVSLEPHADPG